MTTVLETVHDEPEGKKPNLLRRVDAWLRRMSAGSALGRSGWMGATLAMAAAALLVLGAMVQGFLYGGDIHFFSIGVLLVLMAALAALMSLFGMGLLPLIGRLIRGTPPTFLWAILTVLAFGFLAVASSSLSGVVAAAAWGIGAALLGGGLGAVIGQGWAHLSRLQRRFSIFISLVGVVLIVWTVFLFASPGKIIELPGQAGLELTEIEPSGLPNPGEPGSYAVASYTYGSGNDRRVEFGEEADWFSRTVDGSKLIDGWDGLTKIGRDLFWGFGVSDLPLNGRIWMPEGEGPFPLVLIVHGNHLGEDYSDAGYAYLGELMASRGFVFISVDENFLNTLSSDAIWEPVVGIWGGREGLEGENDGRGWLLLEHLRQIRQWNGQAGHPLAGKIDLDRIALIGHSRGGEAVAAAAVLNRLPAYPDNALVKFHYNFNIRAVAAIAPVDGQYWPSKAGTTLVDTSYFTIQGSHDADMRSFEGSIVWQRVKLNPDGPWFKAYAYVYGANHGQFNESWGNDYGGLGGLLLNRANLIPAEDQRRIAQVYLSAFLEATLHEEVGYRALFENALAGREWLPDVQIVTRYQEAGEQMASTFEEDVNVTSATIAGASLNGRSLTGWNEQRVSLKWGELETKAVFLEWNDGFGIYELRLEPGSSLPVGGQLVFAAADNRKPAPDNEPIDFAIMMEDSEGDTARLALHLVAPLPLPVAGEVTKLPSGDATHELVFQGYAFDMAEFEQRSPAFDAEKLAVVRFVFGQTPEGSIVLDDIGFRP